MRNIKNCKISKSALAILLGATVLTGCNQVKDPSVNHPKYTDGKGNEVTKEEFDRLVEEKQREKDANYQRQFKNELEILNYFRDELANLKIASNNEPFENFKEKWYEKSTAIGDFIIEGSTYKYNGEDTGITFSDLSDYAKQEIVDISMKIDDKIVEYFPDYPKLKEYVGSKITSIKFTLKDTTINVIGEDNYEKFGIKKDEIIEEAKSGYKSAKDYVKQWYDDLKDKHNSK